MTTTVTSGERVIAFANTGATGMLKFVNDLQLASAARLIGVNTLRIIDRTGSIPPSATVSVSQEGGLLFTRPKQIVTLSRQKPSDVLRIGVLPLICSMIIDQLPTEAAEVPVIK